MDLHVPQGGCLLLTARCGTKDGLKFCLHGAKAKVNAKATSLMKKATSVSSLVMPLSS